MFSFILLVSLVSNPTLTIPKTQVDCIEKNHCFDESGKCTLIQYIYWNFEFESSTFHVVDWRLTSHLYYENKNFNRNSIEHWYRNGDTLYKVEAPFYFESFTLGDPELRERQFKPEIERLRLRVR